MSKKLLSSFSLFLFCFYCFAVPSFASGFNLKSIGGVNTEGKLYDHWWYSGVRPTFSGEAPSDSQVEIIIDESTSQTTADSSGMWQFTPSQSLTSGDHQVSISNNGSLISFTLTLGEEVDWQSIGSSQSSQSLPTVGIIFPTLFLLASGGGAILISKKGFEK